MPLMQDYVIEVEITVRVRNVSVNRSGGAEKIVDYSTVVEESANSYSPGQSIPAATTRAVDELHRKTSQIVRFVQDHEVKRLK
jgi:hypothetical protein